ncbi:hypothetical protein ACVWZR_009034 [Bradyrhizobium sp. i1.3.1]
MRELFDIIRTNPWPFGAGLFVVILMIIAENFGRGIQGDGARQRLLGCRWRRRRLRW